VSRVRGEDDGSDWRDWTRGGIAMGQLVGAVLVVSLAETGAPQLL
jgi:hypothetical protein